MPVSVSAAYTGRVAIAYQAGASFHKKDDHASKYVNLCTAIYECESTGGSQWIREDVIHLKNIELQAEMPPMDLSVFNDVRNVKSPKYLISKVYTNIKSKIYSVSTEYCYLMIEMC